MSGQDLFSLTPDQILKMFSGAFSKYGDINQNTFLGFYQELSNRIIAYEIQTSWVWIWISIAFIIAGVISLAIAIKKRSDWDDMVCALLGVGGAIFIIAFVIVICAQANDIVTCHTFPEKIVFEQIKQTLKQVLNIVN